MWVSVLGLVLKLALWVLGYLERQKALEEGEQRALRVVLEKADELVNRSRSVRDSVSNDPDAILRDEYNLDRDPERKSSEEKPL